MCPGRGHQQPGSAKVQLGDRYSSIKFEHGFIGWKYPVLVDIGVIKCLKEWQKSTVKLIKQNY